MKRLYALICLSLCLMLPLSAFGESAPYTKEEVIYGVLDASGAPKAFYAVNIFNLSSASTVSDYGAYSAVKNLTDLAPLSNADGLVTADTSSRRFYYQGDMESAALPWNISIAYSLDGNKTDAQALAGASGRVQITLDITKNEAAASEYFDNLLCQVSVALNADKCANISAPGAMIANAGANKTVSIMALPGEGAHAAVSFDAEDFSMDGITIAAVPFSFTLAAPDLTQFTGQLTTLADTVASFSTDTGAVSKTLNAQTLAAGKLKTALQTAADGVRAAQPDTAATLDALVADADTLALALTGAAKDLNAVKVTASALSTMTGDLPAQVQTTVDGLLKSYDHSDYVPTSFTDARNGKISSVQFVLTTSPISKPAAQTVQEEEPSSDFFSRLAALFK